MLSGVLQLGHLRILGDSVCMKIMKFPSLNAIQAHKTLILFSPDITAAAFLRCFTVWDLFLREVSSGSVVFPENQHVLCDALSSHFITVVTMLSITWAFRCILVGHMTGIGWFLQPSTDVLHENVRYSAIKGCVYLERHWHDNVRYSAIKGCIYLERQWQDITVWSSALVPVQFVSQAVFAPCEFVMRFSWRQNHSRSSYIQGAELVRTVSSQWSCVCGDRCHLTWNCSSALRLDLSGSFPLELRLVTLKILV